MVTHAARASLSIALLGNPNTGKSTLFNALCGLRQRVGNYPGVTVEKKTGTLELDGRTLSVIDLPGTYSLAPHSPDEMVAVDVLLGREPGEAPPDALLVIVDASNLERNLYLVSQVLELGRPTVIALNMIDVARSRGIEIDVPRLARQLSVPVVPVQANRKIGLAELQAELARLAAPAAAPRERGEEIFPPEFQAEVAQLGERLGGAGLPRYLVERLLLDSGGYLEETLLAGDGAAMRGELSAARRRLAEGGHPVPAVEAIARYDWVGRVLQGVVTRPRQRPVTLSDRIDRILTHKLLGTLVFLGLMLLVFRSVFAWAEPAMGWIEGGVGWLAETLAGRLADGPLKSLLIDGVFGGVGGVLVFLPQIFILFFFIAVLEDCGYMARAAYLMDKLMVCVGLSGKSFIPLLSSFACAIPGIMAARVIENRRDRLTTILVAPLMSCSARLPVYTVLIAAFVPDRAFAGGWLTFAGLVLFSMYLLGIVTAVLVALVLKKTILRGETPAFVMELPSYKLPSWRTILWRMLERGWAFVRRAGTLIFAVAIVIWAAAYYPRSEAQIDPALLARLAAVEEEIALVESEPLAEARLEALEARRSALANQIDGLHLRNSFLGRAGQAIEPLVQPLGWDWRIGCAVIASFPAREVVVGTLGVIYNLGSETDEASPALRDSLRAAKWDDTGRPVFNLPVALSLMVFFSLCAQCAATLAVIRRETGSWRWSLFTFVYMTGLAYMAALVTYQIGIRIGERGA